MIHVLLQNDSIPDGHIIEHTFFSDEFTDEDWNKPTVMMRSRLLVCDAEQAPEYIGPSIPPFPPILT